MLLTLASSQLPSALQVCHDLTRPDGPPLTQPDLQRLPGRERDVDLFLREVARRLSGRLPEQFCRDGKPTTPAQQLSWAAAAAYLSSRLHVDASEVAQTAGFEQRKPDMSPAAGAAFRAVLAEVAKEDVDHESAELANPNDTVADGAAAEHAPQARVEAARKMQSRAACDTIQIRGPQPSALQAPPAAKCLPIIAKRAFATQAITRSCSRTSLALTDRPCRSRRCSACPGVSATWTPF